MAGRFIIYIFWPYKGERSFGIKLQNAGILRGMGHTLDESFLDGISYLHEHL